MTGGVSGRSDPDRYAGVEDGPEVEHRILGSRFLGRTFRVASDDDTAERLHEVTRVHHAATHHCWASRTGPPGTVVERSDDAGEPTGTAGRPILDRLRRADVHDALVVVTRWFGGTKLGTGGLARAYAEAAARALEAAPRRPLVRTAGLELVCAFDDLGSVEAVLARAGAEIVEIARTWDPAPGFRIRALRSRARALAAALVEATAGRVRVEPDPRETEP